MGPLICVENLRKTYRSGLLGTRSSITALNGVSLTIERGSVFGLVGESGCGKTTLARVMLGLERKTAGGISWEGNELSELTRREARLLRHRMQIVFQDPNSALDPKLPVEASLSEGLANKGFPKRERQKRVVSLVERVGIPVDHIKRYPHEFSGGQRQRLVIARALSMEPEFLILDEPVSNLDVSIQAQIINLLMELREEFNLTYLFISHDVNLVAYIADEMAVMFEGNIVEEGHAEQVSGEPLHPYTKLLIRSIPSVRGAVGQDIPTSVLHGGKQKIGDGCPFYDRCPERLTNCATERQIMREITPSRFVACGKLVYY